MPATSAKSSTKSKDTADKGAAKPTGAAVKVDINVATIDQLKAIKGIGRSRAEEIVRYRGKQGPFASVDDIARVPHVGDMPVEELKAVKAQFVVRLADDQAPPTAPDQPKVPVSSPSPTRPPAPKPDTGP